MLFLQQLPSFTLLIRIRQEKTQGKGCPSFQPLLSRDNTMHLERFGTPSLLTLWTGEERLCHCQAKLVVAYPLQELVVQGPEEYSTYFL